MGATPVLVGRGGTTSEGLRHRRSSFRVTALPTTAAVVRDRVARDVAGLNPGPYASGFLEQRSFVIEVTTVLRPADRRAVMLFATAPEAFYETASRATAYRLQDVTNTSGLARTSAALDVTCQRTTATRTVTADFLWLVDTSRSMEDDQERLGNTAERFFREMNSAGIHFRVGVMQAGSRADGLNLDDPGFAWINGSDPMGPQQLAWQVTYRPYRDQSPDTLSPYPLEGQEEEPLAAGIVTTDVMDRRAPMDPTSRRSFRPEATRAAFFVTDEIGTNDADGRDLTRMSRDGARRVPTACARRRAGTPITTFSPSGWRTSSRARSAPRSTTSSRAWCSATEARTSRSTRPSTPRSPPRSRASQTRWRARRASSPSTTRRSRRRCVSLWMLASRRARAPTASTGIRRRARSCSAGTRTARVAVSSVALRTSGG